MNRENKVNEGMRLTTETIVCGLTKERIHESFYDVLP